MQDSGVENNNCYLQGIWINCVRDGLRSWGVEYVQNHVLERTDVRTCPPRVGIPNNFSSIDQLCAS